MDKRIKEIKRMWHEDGDINDETFYWAFYWLAKQSERVQELENQLHQAQAKAGLYKHALEEIIRQHELEDEIDDYDFMWNVKQIARQALEESK